MYETMKTTAVILIVLGAVLFIASLIFKPAEKKEVLYDFAFNQMDRGWIYSRGINEDELNRLIKQYGDYGYIEFRVREDKQ